MAKNGTAFGTPPSILTHAQSWTFESLKNGWVLSLLASLAINVVENMFLLFGVTLADSGLADLDYYTLYGVFADCGLCCWFELLVSYWIVSCY